jgi:hypothetical protein
VRLPNGEWARCNSNGAARVAPEKLGRTPGLPRHLFVRQAWVQRMVKAKRKGSDDPRAATATVAKDEVGYPLIPSTRHHMPGAKDSVLKQVVCEERGIRRSKRNEYHNPALGLADWIIADENPENLYMYLLNGAHDLLAACKEIPISSVRDIATTTKGGEESDRAAIAKAMWLRQIAERKGQLSREFAAAAFLASAENLSEATNKTPRVFEAALAFADAWHWLHLELSGEHFLAAEGQKARQDRASGPQAKAVKAQPAKRIVLELYLAFLEDHQDRPAMQRSQTSALHTIEEPVRRRLQEAGLDEYSPETLRTMIGKFSRHPSLQAKYPALRR